VARRGTVRRRDHILGVGRRHGGRGGRSPGPARNPGRGRRAQSQQVPDATSIRGRGRTGSPLPAGRVGGRGPRRGRRVRLPADHQTHHGSGQPLRLPSGRRPCVGTPVCAGGGRDPGHVLGDVRGRRHRSRPAGPAGGVLPRWARVSDRGVGLGRRALPRLGGGPDHRRGWHLRRRCPSRAHLVARRGPGQGAPCGGGRSPGPGPAPQRHARGGAVPPGRAAPAGDRRPGRRRRVGPDRPADRRVRPDPCCGRRWSGGQTRGATLSPDRHPHRRDVSHQRCGRGRAGARAAGGQHLRQGVPVEDHRSAG